MSDDVHETQPNPAVTEFFVEHLGDVNAEQIAASESRDSKAVQVFAAASVVLGLVAAAADRPLTKLLGIAIVAYVLVGAASGYVVWPRTLLIRPYDKLWQQLHDEALDDARHTLVHLLAAAYPGTRR
jgi:hypothetical protein